MDEDKTALVEKILKELNHVLKQPGLICFDIIPAESNKNKSPVLFEDTTVGLESWCIKHVYLYCYKEIMDNYLTNPKGRLSKPTHQNYERLIVLLNATLLINPDVTTLWNKRREMLQKNFLEWVSELQFSRLAVSRKPKCSEAYSYRKWILQDVLKEEVVHRFQFIATMLDEELRVCDMNADKCTNNYHGWEYRRWLMTTAWSIRYDFDCTLLYFTEYRFVLNWSASHISDHSSLHYRQFLLKKLYCIEERWAEFERELRVNLHAGFLKFLASYISNKALKRNINHDDLIILMVGLSPASCKCNVNYYSICRRLELLFFELVMNDRLIRFYKYHETLWYHRRFIVHEILEAIYEHLGIEKKGGRLQGKIQKIEERKICQNCPISNSIFDNVLYVYVCPLYIVLVRHEKEFVKERRKDSDKYADKHEHYLKNIEGLKL